MRTEAEIKTIVRLMKQAVTAPITEANAEHSARTAGILKVIDALDWVLEEPSSFEELVAKPYHAIDRAIKKARRN